MATSTETEPHAGYGMISDDEREEILKEIESSVRPGRAAIEPAGRRGGGAALPLAVNAAALILVAAALILIPGFYDLGERRLVGEAEPEAAAGDLYRALRLESDERIQERDETIGSLQSKYSQVLGERESLRRDFDRRVDVRAGQLEAELRAELDVERLSLIASGAAEAVAEARLRELEERLQAQRRSELADFSARLQAEISEKDRSLAEAQARFVDELQRRTDPLKAEIELLTAREGSRAQAQRDLLSRNESLRRELEKAKADYAAELAAMTGELRDVRAEADRLRGRESARRAQEERLGALLIRYTAAPAPAVAAGPQPGALELLQAKVDTRALLASEPVKSAYPGLAERLDRYFEYYEAEYRRQGRAAALRETSEIVEGLAARREPRGLSQGDAELRRFMEALKAALR